MRASRATAIFVALAAVAAAAFSGGWGAGREVPEGLPGMPPPFFGVGVVGSGGRVGAVDAYGNLVGLWERPAGQELGSEEHEAVWVARTRVGGKWMPFWRADAIRQRYLPGTNVLVTTARFGRRKATLVRSSGGARAAADRRWLARSRALGSGAPAWARRLYGRSLLVLRGLTDREGGAVAAGARDDWDYIWPRDAAAVGMAFAASGHERESRLIARFLARLDVDAAARFYADGVPVEGRGAQGDAAGWVTAAARAADLTATGLLDGPAGQSEHLWRGRADYQEKSSGDYLGNALAADGVAAEFKTPRGLVRVGGDPESGLDTAAAWAVRPFRRAALLPAARRTLLRLTAESGRFGLLPSEDWDGGEDPWTAPTAWSAWGLAALGERRAAMRLLAELRRAATPLGLLPERVDADSGEPRSTTPLAWSHAFAILALQELWPGGAVDRVPIVASKRRAPRWGVR